MVNIAEKIGCLKIPMPPEGWFPDHTKIPDMPDDPVIHRAIIDIISDPDGVKKDNYIRDEPERPEKSVYDS